MRSDDPLALAIIDAIRRGDFAALEERLAETPGLANARIEALETCGRTSRSLLHIATDWPGHYPNVTETVKLLVSAGADPNARFEGPHSETPLHWAASSDDVDALDALLDAGADIEARGAVIGGGTPLADATAFGQWNAARRLVERGAQTTLWEASALGLVPRIEGLLAAERHEQPAITRAFWGACHGGHRPAAELLLERGADPNWVGWDRLTPLDAAARSNATEVVDWLRSIGARSARG